jgi:hypothetical protein
LKSLNIVLPDVVPPVVDGYVPAFAQLPFGACVEINMIAELEATQP